MSEPTCFVGIDVSKNTLEVCALPGPKRNQFDNNPCGLVELLAWLRPLAPELVVLEPTGGYELEILNALSDAHLPVALVNARQIRDSAKSRGRLAKTDTIDAEIIALFAQANRPEVRPMPDPAQRQMQALVVRRRQLIEVRATEQARKHLAAPSVRPSIEMLIEHLSQQLVELDGQIQELLEQNSTAAAGRAAHQCHWRRKCNPGDDDCAAARVGDAQSQTDQCAGRSGAAELR